MVNFIKSLVKRTGRNLKFICIATDDLDSDLRYEWY